MTFLAPVPGATVGKYNRGFQALKKLGLWGPAKLCLDMQDSASYGGTGQTWTDLTGISSAFNFGSGSGSDAADPTFTGTAGALGSYAAMDGGDYFTYSTSNPSWLENCHKDNAKFGLLAWFYPGSIGAQHFLFGTNGNQATSIGIGFRIIASGALSLSVYNASGTAALGGVQTTALATATAWQCLGVSVDEAAGTGILQINGTFETFTSTYSSPSAASATYTAQIGASGNSSVIVPSGSRLAMLAAFEGFAPSKMDMLRFFEATRGAFGV